MYFQNALDARLSLLHHGMLLAHALQQSGTGCDAFLRRNLEWMGKAANWSKYSATASIGAIHRVRSRLPTSSVFKLVEAIVIARNTGGCSLLCLYMPGPFCDSLSPYKHGY